MSVCSLTMGQVYSEHRDEDGFLYVAYSGENTFGRRSDVTYQRHSAVPNNDVWICFHNSYPS